jgi:hypothetical protein
LNRRFGLMVVNDAHDHFINNDGGGLRRGPGSPEQMDLLALHRVRSWEGELVQMKRDGTLDRINASVQTAANFFDIRVGGRARAGG